MKGFLESVEVVQGESSFQEIRGTVRAPDGQRYAVAGEVRIDTSPEGDPRATLDKAERILRAAHAPSHPSPADRRVAAKAAVSSCPTEKRSACIS